MSGLEPSLILLSGRLDTARRSVNRLPSLHADNAGFWAKITASTSVNANQWKYAWTEVVWGMSGGILAYSIPADARTGSASISGIGTTGYAWNAMEMENTSADVGSGWSDQTLSKSSGTMVFDAVNPIGTTQKGNSKLPIVWMRPVSIADSNHLVYLFSGVNSPVITGTGASCADGTGLSGSHSIPLVASTLSSPTFENTFDFQVWPAGTLANCCYQVDVHVSGTFTLAGAFASDSQWYVRVGDGRGFNFIFKTTACNNSNTFGTSQYTKSGLGTVTESFSQDFRFYVCQNPGIFNMRIKQGIFNPGASAAGSSMQSDWTWTVTNLGATCA